MSIKQIGFTLIEVLIVVAIVGLLAAIAFPSYQDYVVKSRVTEGLSLAASAKTTITENAVHGISPLDRGWVAPSATPTVSSVAVNIAGAITVNYTALARSIIISLTPTNGGAALVAGTIPSNPIVWTCAVNLAANNRYVPSNCRV